MNQQTFPSYEERVGDVPPNMLGEFERFLPYVEDDVPEDEYDERFAFMYDVLTDMGDDDRGCPGVLSAKYRYVKQDLAAKELKADEGNESNGVVTHYDAQDLDWEENPQIRVGHVFQAIKDIFPEDVEQEERDNAHDLWSFGVSTDQYEELYQAWKKEEREDEHL